MNRRQLATASLPHVRKGTAARFRLQRVAMVVALVISCCEISSCVKFSVESKAPSPNEPPSTTLANVPVNNDTMPAVVTSLYWDGHDNDGFVVGFQYRYTTYPLGKSRGDSVVQGWITTTSHTDTLTFPSPDPLNLQVFRVRAVDNSGNVDPAPATLVFYTLQTNTPVTKILSPTTGSEFYVVPQTNYWFPGVVVTMTAQVPWSSNPALQGSSIIQYGWSADNGPVHWVPAMDSVVTVTPQDFKPPLTGTHTIHAMSQSNTLLIDSIGATISVKLVQPTFQKDIVILDDTQPDVSIRNASKASIDSFYAAIFGANNSYSIDVRDLQTRAFPSRTVLGYYKLAIWHHDDSNIPFYMGNAVAIQTIEDYLHVGGNLIICGTRTWEAWLPPADPTMGLPHPFSFQPGTFVYDFLHIYAGDESAFTPGDFSRATGVDGFTDVEVDTSKINPSYPQYSKPQWVSVVARPGPFTRTLLTFKDKDPYATGLPCAIRYYGDTYNITWLGFPLWALKYNDAQTLAQQILKDMGY